MRHHGRVGIALAAFASVALAQPAENYLNPGTMGANALPPQASEAPWVGTDWQAELMVAAQQADYSGGARDYSLTTPFRVSYPFAGRVALLVEGTPLEAWVVSRQTTEAWRPTDWRGLTKGDLRIGAKFLLFEGNAFLPGIALRALTKTTTGKGVADHRFINAPGYLFDLLFGHRFALGAEAAIELWAAGGFLAWQQAGFGQNDAISWSGAVALSHVERRLVIDLRGYQGWQRDDKPIALNVAVEIPFERGLRFVAGVTRGFRDPALWDVRLGLRFSSPTPR